MMPAIMIILLGPFRSPFLLCGSLSCACISWHSFCLSPHAVDHGAFLLAAIECGNVEVAFEYAGLFNPVGDSSIICFYNLLMAAYLQANDSDALELSVATARRRGIPLNGLSFGLLLLAGKAQVSLICQNILDSSSHRLENLFVPLCG